MAPEGFAAEAGLATRHADRHKTVDRVMEMIDFIKRPPIVVV
ncbi:hypothetical protein BATR1942_19475 [Bacillus atrophaeus 1942]|uniref:Uncharacterized protein n=1 Tax=Bacillus atrophaeus (strain 1942) TaxID=720555 RepID=A0ABM5M471_BACA1|nr:hypothetical protein BATR1942_19475 [Bacillus atrophaeus 1942]